MSAHPVYTERTYSLYKLGVYQPIEDEIDEEIISGIVPRPWFWLAVMAGGGTLLVGMYLFANGSRMFTGTSDPIRPEPEARHKTDFHSFRAVLDLYEAYLTEQP
jgi:hypothetical protein